MTKLVQIEFENIEKLNAAIDKVIKGEEVFRTYAGSDNEPKKKKIISKNRLYVGDNYSVSINKADNGKVYFAIEYYGFEDRLRVAKLTNNSEL